LRALKRFGVLDDHMKRCMSDISDAINVARESKAA
jgi:hypothetical protein